MSNENYFILDTALKAVALLSFLTIIWGLYALAFHPATES